MVLTLQTHPLLRIVLARQPIRYCGLYWRGNPSATVDCTDAATNRPALRPNFIGADGIGLIGTELFRIDCATTKFSGATGSPARRLSIAS